MRSLLVIFCLSLAIVYITAVPVSNQGEDELMSSREGSVARPKRTIGILRDIFPNFSQMIDRKIQQLTRIIFRIVGRLVLTGGGGGGGGGGGSDSDDDRKVSITLPTYPPDLVDDEEEDSTDTSTPADSSTDATTPDGAENSVARIKRDTSKQDLEEDEEDEDLEPEATGDNEVSDDNDAESSENDDEDEDEDPRNKRFLNFNLGASADAQASTGGGSGSGGGSGNFIFDIIRLVAGSGSSGQGSTDSGDGSTNAALEEPKDGVGVPGPLTRLFVVANKGVSALIQDLILRLAQTSEKIVNFKARLITSII